MFETFVKKHAYECFINFERISEIYDHVMYEFWCCRLVTVTGNIDHYRHVTKDMIMYTRNSVNMKTIPRVSWISLQRTEETTPLSGHQTVTEIS